VLRSACPWNLIYRKSTAKFDDQAAQEKAADAYAVQTIRGLRTAGAAGFQLICAVQVGDTWEMLDSNGISGIDDGPGNHAVNCDDMLINQYGVEVFDCVMDWGTQHGVQGKTFLTINHFKQTFPNHQFYAIPIGQAGSN
jgi:hypothetical protein